MEEFNDIIAAGWTQAGADRATLQAFTQDSAYAAETALVKQVEAYLEGYATPDTTADRKQAGNAHVRALIKRMVG